MKKFVLVALVCLFTIVASGLAAERVCLVEFFTNTSCGPCAAADPYVDSLAEARGEEVALLEIHPWWPSSSDPFYVYNKPDNGGRTRRYQSFGAYVDGVPSFVLDGKELTYYTYEQTDLPPRLATSAPLSIEITPGDSIQVDVNVETTVSGGNQRLFVAFTQMNNHFAAPIGIDEFHNVLRKILPDTLGMPIDLTSTGSQTFYFPYTWDGSVWDSLDMKIVAWAQDMSLAPNTYGVHNANWMWWPADYRYKYDNGITSDEVTTATLVGLGGGDLTNIGELQDTYVIKLDNVIITDGWDVTLKIGGSGAGDSTQTSLPVDSSTTIDVEFNTPTGGAGYADLVITSVGNQRSKTVTYSVFKNPNILVLDRDQGDSYETYYMASLIRLGEKAKVYTGYPTGSFLSGYEIVIWMTGEANNLHIGPSDTLAFGQYIDGGGNLFMCSQDFASYFGRLYRGNPAYVVYYNWFKGRFRADTVGSSAGISSVIGSTNGPFDGLGFTLGGGDGANNVIRLDMVAPLAGADTCMQYNGGSIPCAGVRYDSTVVFFTFPWEAINDQADRDTLMAAVLRYLRDEWVPGGVGDQINKPDAPLILSAVPNPFNPTTELSFELSSPGDVSLDIFDLSGRKIVNLANGTFEDGIHKFAWDGRDDTNRELSSGIYMARLVAGEKIVTKKLLLAK